MRPAARESVPACIGRFRVTAVVHAAKGFCRGASITGSALIAWLFHLGILQAQENLEAVIHEGEDIPSGASQLAGRELAQTGEAGHGGFCLQGCRTTLAAGIAHACARPRARPSFPCAWDGGMCAAVPHPQSCALQCC